MTPESDTAAEPLLVHVETAMEILGEERAALMRGAFDQVERLTIRKKQVLELLEPAIRVAPRSRRAVAALTRLIADSRRNEMILAAARDGIGQARRRIAAIARARRGVVAYLEDGTMLSCGPARADTDRSA